MSTCVMRSVLRSSVFLCALAACKSGHVVTPKTPGTSSVVATYPAVTIPVGDTSRVLRLRIAPKSLVGNLLGDTATRTVLVYLPPDYATSGKRYRTVYMLHGFGQRRNGQNAWLTGYKGFHLGHTMDSLGVAGAVQDLIMIAPDASNFYGGAFYRDSPVAGNWETYIVRELVGTIDATFRTIPKRESRGLIGHSMGGYGTMSLVAKHPDVFGAAYAMSPCCIAVDENPGESAPIWKALLAAPDRPAVISAGFLGQAFVALGSAYAPNTTKPPLYIDMPVQLVGDRVVAVPSVVAKWKAQAPLHLLDSLSDNLRTLRAFGFDAGRSDNFRDIPILTPIIDSMLTARKIAHRFELYDGDHGNRIAQRLPAIVLPFIDKALAR